MTMSQVPSRCPLRRGQAHTSKRPVILSVVAIKDIEQQITTNRYRPLPYLGIATRFYRCTECCAVWVAGSLYERVSEDQACGVYDRSFNWTPYPFYQA